MLEYPQIFKISHHLSRGERLALGREGLQWVDHKKTQPPTPDEMESIVAVFQDLAEFAYKDSADEKLVEKSIEDFNSRILAVYNENSPHKIAPILTRLVLNASKYGHKTANLMEMEGLVKGIAVVPAYHPISHQELWGFLAQNSNLEDLFLAFQQAQGSETGLLTGPAKEVLSEIREQVTLALLKFDSPALRSWLGNADLAYRSSSLEDKRSNANAGGNASVIGVVPTWDACIESLQMVTASFFSEKSLTQRLLAKDDILARPFVSVLVQNMVGEPVGGNDADIYVSGVGFYHEAEGRTEEELHLQAAPGLGEYIVNSMGAADSYFEGPGGQVKSIITEKPQRLVRGETTAVFAPNPRPKQSSLTDDQVHKLKEIAIRLRQHYGYDVDFEFGVKTNTGEISIFQVRPIVHSGAIKPSYLTDINPTEGCETITYGGGAAREIREDRQVICAQTLAEAHAAFLSRRDKGTVQAVLIAKWAPATSHEATIFRTCDIPIMKHPAPSKVKQWLGTRGRKLAVSPQQAYLGFLEFHTAMNIQEGWYRHPTPIIRSLRPQTASPAIRVNVQDRLLEGNSFYPKDTPTRELLDLICCSDQSASRKALATLLKRLYDIKTQASLAERHEIKEMTSQLFEHGLLTANELFIASTPMQRLMARNTFEAIFYQNQPASIVHPNSIRTSLTYLKKEREIELQIGADVSSPERHYLIQLYKLSMMIPQGNLRDRWKKFTYNLAIGPQGLKRLKILASSCTELIRFGVMAHWINRDFSQVPPESESSIPLNLRSSLRKQAAVYQWIEAQGIEIKRLETMESLWADPEKFSFAHSQSKEIIECLTQQLAAVYQGTDDLSRSSVHSLLLRTVGTLDRSIKNLTGSPLYTESMLKVKARNFIQALELIIMLLEELCQEGPTEKLSRTLQEHINLCREFFKESTKLLDSASSPHQTKAIQNLFKLSSRFSTCELQLPDSIQPVETMEEAFTLIHQDLLLLLSVLQRPLMIEPSQISKEMHHVYQAVEAISTRIDTLYHWEGDTLVDSKIEYPWCVMTLNLPLQYHSLQLELKQHLKTGDAILKVDFSGMNKWPTDPLDRMNTVCALAAIVANGEELSFPSGHHPYYDGSSAQFAWAIPSEIFRRPSFMAALRYYLSTMVFVTMPHHWIGQAPPAPLLRVTNRKFTCGGAGSIRASARLRELSETLELDPKFTRDEALSIPVIAPLVLTEGSTADRQDLAGDLIAQAYHDSSVTEWTLREAWDTLITDPSSMERSLKPLFAKWPADRVVAICQTWFRDYLELVSYSTQPLWTEIGYELISKTLLNQYDQAAPPQSVASVLEFIMVTHIHSTMAYCPDWHSLLERLEQIEDKHPGRVKISARAQEIIHEFTQRRPGHSMVYSEASFEFAKKVLVGWKDWSVLAELISDTLIRLHLEGPDPLPCPAEIASLFNHNLFYSLRDLLHGDPSQARPARNQAIRLLCQHPWFAEERLWELLSYELPNTATFDLYIQHLAENDINAVAWQQTACRLAEILPQGTPDITALLEGDKKVHFAGAILQEKTSNPEWNLPAEAIMTCWKLLIELYKDSNTSGAAHGALRNLLIGQPSQFVCYHPWSPVLRMLGKAEAEIPAGREPICKLFAGLENKSHLVCIGDLAIGSAEDLHKVALEKDPKSVFAGCEKILRAQSEGYLDQLVKSGLFGDATRQTEVVEAACKILLQLWVASEESPRSSQSSCPR